MAFHTNPKDLAIKKNLKKKEEEKKGGGRSCLAQVIRTIFKIDWKEILRAIIP